MKENDKCKLDFATFLGIFCLIVALVVLLAGFGSLFSVSSKSGDISLYLKSSLQALGAFIGSIGLFLLYIVKLFFKHFWKPILLFVVGRAIRNIVENIVVERVQEKYDFYWISFRHYTGHRLFTCDYFNCLDKLILIVSHILIFAGALFVGSEMARYFEITDPNPGNSVGGFLISVVIYFWVHFADYYSRRSY